MLLGKLHRQAKMFFNYEECSTHYFFCLNSLPISLDNVSQGTLLMVLDDLDPCIQKDQHPCGNYNFFFLLVHEKNKSFGIPHQYWKQISMRIFVMKAEPILSELLVTDKRMCFIFHGMHTKMILCFVFSENVLHSFRNRYFG